MKRSAQSLISRPHGFAYIAFWQFMAFSILLLLIWADEVLDLTSLLFGTPEEPPNVFRGCLLSAGVLLTAIITVAHTYAQQKRIIRGLLIVCSYCHKIRIERGVWDQLENYVADRSEVAFSHGVCPECFNGIVGTVYDGKAKKDG